MVTGHLGLAGHYVRCHVKKGHTLVTEPASSLTTPHMVTTAPETRPISRLVIMALVQVNV